MTASLTETKNIEDFIQVLAEEMKTCEVKSPDNRTYAALVLSIENFSKALLATDPDARYEYILRGMRYSEEVF